MWKKVRITAAGTGMRTVAKEEGQHITRYNIHELLIANAHIILHAGEGHEVVMDEPQKMGGTDTGATPLHTLLASLAGCEHGKFHHSPHQLASSLIVLAADRCLPQRLRCSWPAK
jgi:hypothetical protein